MTRHINTPLGEVTALLPYDLRQAVEGLPIEEQAKMEEIRLRQGQPPMIVGERGELPLPRCERVRIRGEDLASVIEIASQASTHTVLAQIRKGFVTIKGGHRLGLCGSGVMVEGELYNLRHLSSLSLRIAREVPTVAEGLLPGLIREGKLLNTIILAPPGMGKTTLLRDLIRRISDGVDIPPQRVGVADERGEIASLWEGIPQLNVGGRTDVMDDCPKGLAMLMLLRGMTPQVIATDEITAPEDVEGLAQAVGCGVSLLATAHGEGVSSLRHRPIYREMLKQGLFDAVVTLSKGEGGRRCHVTHLEEGNST